MDLLKIGTQALMDKFGGMDKSSLTDALSGLMAGSDGDSSFDVMGLVSKMQSSDTSSDLTDIAASWLGDGENAPVSAEQLKEVFSQDQIASFAQKLNVDEDTALDSLSEALPSMVDQGSDNGSLMDMASGGLGGLMDMASKFLK